MSGVSGGAPPEGRTGPAGRRRLRRRGRGRVSAAFGIVMMAVIVGYGAVQLIAGLVEVLAAHWRRRRAVRAALGE